MESHRLILGCSLGPYPRGLHAFEGDGHWYRCFSRRPNTVVYTSAYGWRGPLHDRRFTLTVCARLRVYRRQAERIWPEHYGYAATRRSGFGSDSCFHTTRWNTAKCFHRAPGVRVRGDRPLWKMVFWSIRMVLSPEAYINMKIDPGGGFHWNLT